MRKLTRGHVLLAEARQGQTTTPRGATQLKLQEVAEPREGPVDVEADRISVQEELGASA